MFTVLHRDEYGNETLWQATHVRKLNKSAADAQFACEPGVMLDLAGGETVHFGFMNCRSTEWPATPAIFVMNESGKTVAHYDL